MDPLEHLTNVSKEIRLSDAERLRIRANLLARIASTRSPVVPFFAQPFFRAGTFAFSLFILVGGGTAFAAEGALPGNPIYAVKVSVVEPIVGALQFKKSDQALWQVTLATRRISEAETVATDQAAPAEVKRAAVESAALSVTDAAQTIEQVAKVDQQGAAQAALKFDTTVVDHGPALEAIAVATSTSATSTAILQALSDEADESHSVADTAEATNAPKTPAFTAALRAEVVATSTAPSVKTTKNKSRVDTAAYRAASQLFKRTRALAGSAEQGSE